MLRASVVAISVLVVTTGLVDHGKDQVSAPTPSVSATYFVHTPCIYVNPGGQWRCPPGSVPPEFP